MSVITDRLKTQYGFENPFAPDQLSVKASAFIKEGIRILDVGCGEGADSVYYAQKGLQVDAIENNESYLDRLRLYKHDTKLDNLTIYKSDLLKYPYAPDHYGAINCLLVGCCMAKSEFEKMLILLKQAVKINGIIIMSLRNYLDPELEEYRTNSKMIEPNSFVKNDDCCEIRYFIEKGRLRELFDDFEILYYYEGLMPDKYQKTDTHGDSYIICKKSNKTFK